MAAVADANTEALTLSESVFVLEESRTLTDPKTGEIKFMPLPGQVFDADGRVPVHVIRPGVGKGKGRHLYEADMLERDAGVFTGWKSYVDHLSPAAKKAADGLPRSLRDLGGRITESWWDGTVPENADKGHGQGAVIGLVKPVPWVRELIQNDPELVEASISASATGVKPTMHGGQRVWLVEGINPRGSVDFVTEAGAGGRIAPLLEAAYADDEEAERVLLESMTDDEVTEHLREFRPHLLREAGQSPTKDDPAEGGAVSDITVTPEQLQEALSAPDVLSSILTSPVVEGYINTIVESRLEESRDAAGETALTEARRELRLRDMRDEAHRIIEESGLPDGWQRDLKARYDLAEGLPTAKLNVTDAVEDGKVVKVALEVLRESIEADISHERERLAEVQPTRVRSRPTPVSTPGGDATKPTTPAFNPKNTGYGRLLESAGVSADKAYHTIEEAAAQS